MRSLAFKCTFNDGDQGDWVGFANTCSRDQMVHNVDTRVWCGDKTSPCAKFVRSGMKGSPPESPCMESALFKTWAVCGGEYHSGDKRGTPITIRGTEPGKIVILTTRFPSTSEGERKIIGLFEIDHINDDGWLIGQPETGLRLPITNARLMDFWRYYRDSSDKPFWGSQLHRYLEDAQIHRILTDLLSVVSGADREKVGDILHRHFGDAQAPAADGTLASTLLPLPRLINLRKYGFGGEGPDHKKLKEWIAATPTSIGLPANSTPHIEFGFESGDCVDIAFEISKDQWAVVEIETTTPKPGAHQVIKYRELLNAKKNWSIGSEMVTGILVAWSFDNHTLEFCTNYGIQAWSCRVKDTGKREN